MKEQQFDKAVSLVYRLSDLSSEEEIFEKTKRQDVVRARHFIYHLCFKRGMGWTDIQREFSKRGLDQPRQTIAYGSDKFAERMRKYRDYNNIFKKAMNELDTTEVFVS